MTSPSSTGDHETPGVAFARNLHLFGNAVAVVVDGGKSITYAELADRADAFAASLGRPACLLLIEPRTNWTRWWPTSERCAGGIQQYLRRPARITRVYAPPLPQTLDFSRVT